VRHFLRQSGVTGVCRTAVPAQDAADILTPLPAQREAPGASSDNHSTHHTFNANHEQSLGVCKREQDNAPHRRRHCAQWYTPICAGQGGSPFQPHLPGGIYPLKCHNKKKYWYRRCQSNSVGLHIEVRCKRPAQKSDA